ncbi:hypothetical protein NQ315_008828 [Exocentrus adspersus]|uniref:DDE Tnp4 domain-containing protein n=1 Tax=Exocentrus adspersus TaxID=1586481 RepID=A0AAV8VC91_9CUCU|nr:hypothetical protein NQ315_008828 [Exocentrus adspersus]
MVDADYRFIYVDVGCNGRSNDSTIFRNSSLNIALENNSLAFPDNGVLVGDDAFPLKTNLLKPYSRNNMTLKEKLFNYKLSSARRIVENAFGILVSRFRVFEKPIALLPQTVDLVILASCALHNWLTSTSSIQYLPPGSTDMEDITTCQVLPGSWHIISACTTFLAFQDFVNFLTIQGAQDKNAQHGDLENVDTEKLRVHIDQVPFKYLTSSDLKSSNLTNENGA